jgi:hypothetical protein
MSLYSPQPIHSGNGIVIDDCNYFSGRALQPCIARHDLATPFDNHFEHRQRLEAWIFQDSPGLCVGLTDYNYDLVRLRRLSVQTYQATAKFGRSPKGRNNDRNGQAELFTLLTPWRVDTSVKPLNEAVDVLCLQVSTRLTRNTSHIVVVVAS